MSLLAGKGEKKELPEGAVTYYQYCTAIPIATLLAQTWDVDVIAQAGDIVGEEMEELGVTLWLAPGMNIHKGRAEACGSGHHHQAFCLQQSGGQPDAHQCPYRGEDDPGDLSEML